MKKILLTGLLISATLSGFSQVGKWAGNIEGDIYSRTISLNEKALAFGLAEAEFEAIKDEAYANPNFLEGSIFQEDRLAKSGVPMRYNAFADEIEIKKSPTDVNYGALIKDPDIFVKIGREIYVFIPFEGSNEKGGYFSVLSDGKTYDLYKKTTSVFKEARKATSTYGRDVPPSFSKSIKYYLVQDGTFLEMPSGKSKILKMMKSKKDEIKSFMKKNKIDVDKEADLIKLVAYFDSLI